MVRAVIFDMDGTMFDTERLLLETLPAIAKEEGFDIPVAAVKRVMGCDSSIARRLNGEFPGLDHCLNEVYQPHRPKYFDALFPEKGMADKKGLAELVDFLNENGIPYGVASSSPRTDIEYFMSRSRAELRPAVVLSGKEGFRSKPDPDIFLAAARSMKVPACDTLVLEDSRYGVMAAKAGGFPCVWIPDVTAADDEMRAAIQMEMEDLGQVKDWLKEEMCHGR